MIHDTTELKILTAKEHYQNKVGVVSMNQEFQNHEKHIHGICFPAAMNHTYIKISEIIKKQTMPFHSRIFKGKDSQHRILTRKYILKLIKDLVGIKAMTLKN